MLTMEINTCSVVLYTGNAPIAAHAGSADTISTWIKQKMLELGNVKVSGWGRLHLLKESEQEKEALVRAEIEGSK